MVLPHEMFIFAFFFKHKPCYCKPWQQSLDCRSSLCKKIDINAYIIFSNKFRPSTDTSKPSRGSVYWLFQSNSKHQTATWQSQLDFLKPLLINFDKFQSTSWPWNLLFSRALYYAIKCFEFNALNVANSNFRNFESAKFSKPLYLR